MPVTDDTDKLHEIDKKVTGLEKEVDFIKSTVTEIKSDVADMKRRPKDVLNIIFTASLTGLIGLIVGFILNLALRV